MTPTSALGPAGSSIGPCCRNIDLDVLARIGRALADDTRRRILVRLLDSPAHPCDLAEELETTRANISNHLTCLRGCGLVVGEPAGRRVRYELVDHHVADALVALGQLRLWPTDDR